MQDPNRPKPSGRGPAKKRPPAAGKPAPKGKGGTSKAAVEIFTASFCPHCKEAVFYLKSRRIPFVEYRLEHSAKAQKRFEGYGGKAIPLLVVKGKILRRWDPAAFEKLYGGGER